MKEIQRTKIEVDAETGILFLVTRTDIADDAGNVTHPGLPHRAPFEPGDEPPEHVLAAKIAALVWTPEIVSAHKQLLEENKKQRQAEEEQVREVLQQTAEAIAKGLSPRALTRALKMPGDIAAPGKKRGKK